MGGAISAKSHGQITPKISRGAPNIMCKKDVILFNHQQVSRHFAFFQLSPGHFPAKDCKILPIVQFDQHKATAQVLSKLTRWIKDAFSYYNQGDKIYVPQHECGMIGGFQGKQKLRGLCRSALRNEDCCTLWVIYILRCAWSSGGTPDPRPLGPGFETRCTQVWGAFILHLIARRPVRLP